jgi:DNA-binding transcriptional LysR family regulator
MPATDLQLDWLRAFVAAVDARSLAGAALRVHRSGSAVSMQIAKLEQAAGRALLLRGPRHFELTPAGLELLPHARALLEQHGRAVAALQERPLSGRVRLGVPDDYAERYLTPVLRQFAERHAAVDVELDCEQSTSLIPRVMRGELDVALISRDSPRRGHWLFDEPLVWVGSPQFEIWRREPLPVAVYEVGSRAREGALKALKAARRGHRVVVNTPSLAGQIAAVDSGLAVAVLTRCSAPGHLIILGERQGLPALPAMQVAVLAAPAGRSPAAVEAFAALMKQTLARPLSPA